MKVWLFLIYFLILPWLKAKPPDVPETDYTSEFGKNWVNAENILLKNQATFQALADSFSVPYNEVISIGFPELVRYSSVKDKMEVTLLKILYTNKGKDYADFSVGIFQMKPSFAEKIREEVWASSDKELKKLFGFNQFMPENRAHRDQLISELDNPISQFEYLIAFYKLFDKRFGDKPWENRIQKIRYYATAYNCGFFHSGDYIESMMDKKFYSIAVLKSGPFYFYSDISAFYYSYLNRKI